MDCHCKTPERMAETPDDDARCANCDGRIDLRPMARCGRRDLHGMHWFERFTGTMSRRTFCLGNVGIIQAQD